MKLFRDQQVEKHCSVSPSSRADINRSPRMFGFGDTLLTQFIEWYEGAKENQQDFISLTRCSNPDNETVYRDWNWLGSKGIFLQSFFTYFILALFRDTVNCVSLVFKCANVYRNIWVWLTNRCKLINILELHTGLQNTSYEKADKLLSKYSCQSYPKLWSSTCRRV